ncbi:MAG: KpsF/GutQ family sugar-phosphate isomerase [Rickettsiales bacterium]|jgi:arabinose-5-phosphate isomerase|nr:KpsF/GutQ family sugar-phosphate isomerase [Rickettsiales bacterium]
MLSLLNNRERILTLGKKSIEIEINGIKTIAEQSIDDKFVKLINTILRIKGRVFLSAIGKPSYIARKAAASLASTGTPSFFIHPSEASHGDLGMITKNDIVILISNSGGSIELNDIVAYCKRRDIKLICITRREDSFLAKSADLAIVLQNMPQTNEINSPTTDTIMFMAYLDAVTTVLIDLRNFGNENFKTFHPGGKLGAQLIKVRDIMRTDNAVPLVNVNKTVPEALREMNIKGVGAVGILDDNNKLTGVISDGDIRRKILEYGNIMVKTIVDLMTPNPKFILEDKLAVEAVATMTEKEKYIQILFIVKESMEVVGILHIQDLFKAGVI